MTGYDVIIIAVIGFVVWGYIHLGLTWLFYLAISNLQRQPEVHKAVKPIAWVITKLAYSINVSFNWIYLSILLYEFPKELFSTTRISRHKLHSTGWRKKVADFFCQSTDPYDPRGYHCLKA
jgi:hypothetical protein